jgi:hypothetical protein
VDWAAGLGHGLDASHIEGVDIVAYGEEPMEVRCVNDNSCPCALTCILNVSTPTQGFGPMDEAEANEFFESTDLAALGRVLDAPVESTPAHGTPSPSASQSSAAADRRAEAEARLDPVLALTPEISSPPVAGTPPLEGSPPIAGSPSAPGYTGRQRFGVGGEETVVEGAAKFHEAADRAGGEVQAPMEAHDESRELAGTDPDVEAERAPRRARKQGTTKKRPMVFDEVTQISGQELKRMLTDECARAIEPSHGSMSAHLKWALGRQHALTGSPHPQPDPTPLLPLAASTGAAH